MSVASILRNFFDPATPDPTDRELADLGLSRADYRQLMSAAPGTRARMEALAAEFDVTPEMIDADRGQALELAETCGRCAQAGNCQRALDGHGAFDRNRCPNAWLYQQIAAVA